MSAIECPVRPNLEIENLFAQLCRQWRDETGMLSDPVKKCLHPAYQRIIGLGLQAVPFILEELRTNGGHWFWALSAITGQDPLTTADAGKPKNMAAAWINWGIARGYISAARN